MTEINLKATSADIQSEIEDELRRSKEIHEEKFDSLLTGFGVITEEYYEVVEAFRLSKEKYPEGNIHLRVELVQLAAMSMKMIESCCNDPLVAVADMMDVNFKHSSTMNSLGYLALSYNILSNNIVSCNKKALYENLLSLAWVCKTAIMSNCVYQE